MNPFVNVSLHRYSSTASQLLPFSACIFSLVPHSRIEEKALITSFAPLLTCGRVGRCDSSRYKYGTKHFKETGHSIIKSFYTGEDWKWCKIDEIF
jgi:hypothetical protein